MIYLNKINQRQIFEPEAFNQIMQSVNNPALLVRLLDEYICQAVAFTTAQQNPYALGAMQGQPKMISNVEVEARMNVYDQGMGVEQGRSAWLSRNYVTSAQRNLTHVRIAYIINGQIAQTEKKDPLEYFEQYRKSNGE